MKIQFDNGQIVEFDGQPTEDDVQEIAKSFQPKPMFSNNEEAQIENAKQMGRQAKLEREAEHPYSTALEKTVTDFPAFANKAINTATLNIPEIIANTAGVSLNPTEEQIKDNPVATGTADALGFTAPAGAPMKMIEALNVIKNPLTRSVAQGAGAMATQIPVGKETPEEYATKIAVGGGLGAAGRGVEKVAEGAIQKSAGDLSARIGDYLVKLPTKAFRWSKDPMDVLSKEGKNLVSGNMQEYADKATELLNTRTNQLNDAIADSDKVLNLNEQVQQHLDEATSSLNSSLKRGSSSHESSVSSLDNLKNNLSDDYGDLKNISIQDAVKLRRQLADDFPFTKENENDPVAKAAHKIYWEINNAIDTAEPSIIELNHRVSGLIDISKAAQNRAAVEFRNNPFGLIGRIGAAGLAGAGLMTGHGAEGLLSGMAVLGFEKVINSPALLTRAARALSLMSADEKAEVFLKYPALKKAVSTIKVDARDTEMLPPKSNGEVSTFVKSPKPDIIDVEGKQVFDALPNEERKGLPNLPAEGAGRPNVGDEQFGVTGKKVGEVKAPTRMGTDVQGEQVNLNEQPLPEEKGASSAEAHMPAMEEGAESVSIKKPSSEGYQKFLTDNNLEDNKQARMQYLKKFGWPEAKSSASKLFGNERGSAMLPDDKPMSDLHKEALKYKTAEEFINNTPTVFHGTKYQFDKFEQSHLGKLTHAESAKNAFFFTSKREIAEGYANLGDMPDVEKLQETAEKLERKAQRTGRNEDWDAYSKAYAEYENAALGDENKNYRGDVKELALDIRNPMIVDKRGLSYNEKELANWVKEAKNKGHDALIIKDAADAVDTPIEGGKRPDSEISDVYAVFNQDQIKSKSDLTRIWNESHSKSNPIKSVIMGPLGGMAATGIATAVGLRATNANASDDKLRNIANAFYDTEGLKPGQTPLKIDFNHRFKNTIHGIPLDEQGRLNDEVSRRGFYHVKPGQEKEVIYRQLNSYIQNPKAFGLSRNSTIADMAKVFDRTRPENKIKLLKKIGIDPSTKLSELKGINLTELKKGSQHEKEHTKSVKESSKIAIDHLKEHPNYYSVLEQIFGGKK